MAAIAFNCPRLKCPALALRQAIYPDQTSRMLGIDTKLLFATGLVLMWFACYCRTKGTKRTGAMSVVEIVPSARFAKTRSS